MNFLKKYIKLRDIFCIESYLYQKSSRIAFFIYYYENIYFLPNQYLFL